MALTAEENNSGSPCDAVQSDKQQSISEMQQL